MAEIRQYAPRVEAQGSVRTPQADMRQAGRFAQSNAGEGLVNFGASLAEHDEQRETSDVRAKMAQARAEWTVHLMERAKQAEPGDPNFVANFQRDLGDYLGKLQEGYKYEKTHEVFNVLGATLMGDLHERAVAQQSVLAGQKAKLDVQTQIDQGQNTLLNDPSQFERVLQGVFGDLDTRSGLMPDDRVALKKAASNQLSAAALKSVIRNSPDAGLATLKSGVWDQYMTGESKAALLSEADAGIRAVEVEKRRQEAELKLAKKEDQKQTGDKFITELTNGKLTTRMILDSNLDPTGDNSKEHWINVLRTRNKEALERPIRTSPSEFAAVLNGIRSGSIKNETDIEKYYTVKQTIAWSDIKELRKEFSDQRTPEGERLAQTREAFERGMKPSIVRFGPMNQILSGADQFYAFQHYVGERVQEYKAAGKNPVSLFDPSNTDYLGKSVSMFQRPLTESTKEIAEQYRRKARPPIPAESPPPGDAARKPGETIQQYRERNPR